MKQKKAQQVIGLPFGVIFALFLIVIFIVFAIIGIKYFLGMKNKIMILSFYDDLQEEVKKALFAQERDETISLNLPGGIEKICFINFSANISGQDRIYYKNIKGAYSEENNVFLYF